MLSLQEMITNAAPDAPRDPPPPVPLVCTGCPSLITRHHIAGTVSPHGTSARCLAAKDGVRLIGWEWQPSDRPPHWCPRRSASR